MNAPTLARPQGKPLFQTLDMLSPGQIAAIRRLPSHDNAPIVAIEATRPASIFTSQARYDLEQTKVFRKSAVPVMLSAMIAEPGMAVAHDGYGLPLLFARDREGVARTFLNVCRHKGSKLLEGCDPLKASRLTCPYHAWTYALDGRLAGVARAETFVNLDTASRNLVEMPSREAGGFIWVMLDRHAEPDFSGMDPLLIEDMDAFGIGDAHIYGRKTFHLNANWKLVLEPFLEGYHVQRLHARTVGPLFADVPNVVERLGPNIRQTSGKAQFSPADLDIPGENIHKTVTHAYQVFPNTVVVTSPYYISVMIIIPTGVRTSTVDYYMLTRLPPDSPKAEEIYQRSYEMILGVFGGEDFRAAEISQVGLESGALDDVVYCGLEATIPIYYEYLEKQLTG
jgi:phenylpropionate dioxygenase-like ring-hydroxylating dioxygenase large terminal subunit